MYVTHRFKLNIQSCYQLHDMKPDWGYKGFSEFIFYRTYSRTVCSHHKCCLKTSKDKKTYCPQCGENTPVIKKQEQWSDTVIRVINGLFSIRKDWYLKNQIKWDEDFWQVYAHNMALSLFKMEWSPPGRGLWAMGTDFVYERGSMALQNCGFKVIDEQIGSACHWVMDALMCGVGVGFLPKPQDDLKLFVPVGDFEYQIPDTREGWCDSIKLLIDAFIKPNQLKPVFDYSLIREANLPINGFGGLSSGPAPLKWLHAKIAQFLMQYLQDETYTAVRLKTDIVNCIGCCVISGNVRRSAELCAGDIDDVIDLKNYELYPEREEFGWMSNNSVYLRERDDFLRLDELAERIIKNGEPGIINLVNISKGRIGHDDGLLFDAAEGFNPCGEQPLEDGELCTLAETAPTRTKNWLKSCEYATVYASTVTLLPTHRPETNAVMLRNRRIGVSIMDVVGWMTEVGVTNLTRYLRDGYKHVRKINRWVNNEAGIPLAIRCTTLKPGGTVPRLFGVRSGWQWPTFGYTLRRVRVGATHPICQILKDAGVPNEPDVFSQNTTVFEFPIDQGSNGRVSPATDVNIYKQAMLLVLLQREWSDNAVSNTLYFRPKWNQIKKYDLDTTSPQLTKTEILEEVAQYFPEHSWLNILQDQEIEYENYKLKLEVDKYTDNWTLSIHEYDRNHEENEVPILLASIIPLTKSISLLPHATTGVYRQMPEEGITENEYHNRLSKLSEIDWSKLIDSDGQDERYCEGPHCKVQA